MPRADIISAIEQGQLDDLLDYDELLTELLVDPSCLLSTLGFKEDHITFQPTLCVIPPVSHSLLTRTVHSKYDVGSKEYDTSYKQRSPRWCDRICEYLLSLKTTRCLPVLQCIVLRRLARFVHSYTAATRRLLLIIECVSS